jgi:hypothetical protein
MHAARRMRRGGSRRPIEADAGRTGCGWARSGRRGLQGSSQNPEGPRPCTQPGGAARRGGRGLSRVGGGGSGDPARPRRPVRLTRRPSCCQEAPARRPAGRGRGFELIGWPPIIAVTGAATKGGKRVWPQGRDASDRGAIGACTSCDRLALERALYSYLCTVYTKQGQACGPPLAGWQEICWFNRYVGPIQVFSPPTIL